MRLRQCTQSNNDGRSHHCDHYDDYDNDHDDHDDDDDYDDCDDYRHHSVSLAKTEASRCPVAQLSSCLAAHSKSLDDDDDDDVDDDDDDDDVDDDDDYNCEDHREAAPCESVNLAEVCVCQLPPLVDWYAQPQQLWSFLGLNVDAFNIGHY